MSPPGPIASPASSDPAALLTAANDPRALLRAYAEGMAGLPGELGDLLGRRLRTAVAEEDWASCARVLRQLLEKYLHDFAASLAGGGVNESEQLRELLRQALGVALASLLEPVPELARESAALAEALRRWRPGDDLAALARRARELCHQVGVHAGEAAERQALLLSLFDLLLENLFELLEDGSWLQAQVAGVRQLLLAGPADRHTLEATRQGLRELVYQQSLLRQGIAQTKDAMRGMLDTFVARMEGMADSTGQYQSRLEAHREAIRQARSITELGRRLDEVLEDTAQLQRQAQRAREELVAAREEVEAAEARVRALEEQLREAGDLVRRDPLTGALNLRGLEERYAELAAQAEREARPLALAMVDMDGFREVNSTHGHGGGDAALRHVVQVLRETLRGDDCIARHGGDEFVLVLPGADLDEATALVRRAQRLLAVRVLAHEGRRIPVTFSAGVAVRQLGEAREDLIRRADRAMYQAKSGGRDRVQATR